MKDPLALWRNKDPLTLAESAALLCECPPGLTYDHRNSEERRARDRIATMRKEIVEAAREGAIEATLSYSRPAAGGDGGSFGSHTWRSRDAHGYAGDAQPHIDPSASMVTRANLRAWCEAKGLRPSVLFGETVERADRDLLTATEREAEWVSLELALANRAAREFWSTAEKENAAGHPTNDAVGAWLKKQNDNVCDEAIKRIATLIRPPWAATGRRRKQ